MAVTPIYKLVLTLAIPTIISMLVTNMYNMADTYFVSGLGTSASGATGVVFGLMSMIQAVGFMFGHGALRRRLQLFYPAGSPRHDGQLCAEQHPAL